MRRRSTSSSGERILPVRWQGPAFRLTASRKPRRIDLSTSSASSVRARSAGRRRRFAAACLAADDRRERQQPFESGSIAGGTGSPSSIRSSAPPIRSSSSGSPTGIRRGSSRPPSARPDEGFGDRAHRAIVGQQDAAPGKAQRVLAETLDQPGCERVGERAMRRDGEDRDARSDILAAPFPSAGSIAACRRRTTGPGGRLRSSALPRSPGPTGYWSRMALPARRAAGASTRIWMPVNTNGATWLRSRRRSAPARSMWKSPMPLWLSARASGTSSSSASIFASSQCDASSLSVSAGPSTQRLSLLSARNGSQSISGAAWTSPPPVSSSRLALVRNHDLEPVRAVARWASSASAR